MAAQLDLITVEKATATIALSVLKTICKEDPRVCAKAAVLVNNALKDSETQSDFTPKRKRLLQDRNLKFCIRCEKVYGPSEAKGTEVCVFHDGELEVDWDSDFWADHDEECHGTIDTEENRILYPQGFVWDCCNTVNGESPGCTKFDRHEHSLSNSESSVEDESEDGSKQDSDSDASGPDQSGDEPPAAKRTKLEPEVITIED